MPSSANPSKRAPDAMERLYVLWGVSTLLLLLGILVLAVFGGGALRRQSQVVNQQTQAISVLSERLAVLETAVTHLGARPTATRPANPSRPPESRPATAPASKPAPAQATNTLPDEAAINKLLDEALGNPAAAGGAHAELLGRALREGERANWSGRTWGRLALLAWRAGQDEAAGTLAGRAAARGAFADEYHEAAARRLLEQERWDDALLHAQQLAGQKEVKPIAPLLAAEIWLAKQNPAAAADALDKLTNPGGLAKRDQLWLGRLYVALEQWGKLNELVTRLGAVPEPLTAERDFLRAVWLIQNGGEEPRQRAERLVEALAILDYLREEKPEYAVLAWRGVALTQAGQFEAAREALAQTAERWPDRPEAFYWRGILEIQAGNAPDAASFLQGALAASGRFAPAWEALATLDLNRNDAAAALENLKKAVEINPRRAAAHFLMAVAYAKTARREEAVAALRTALRLDAGLLPTARKTDVLSKMFEPGEMERLPEKPPATQPAASAREG